MDKWTVPLALLALASPAAAVPAGNPADGYPAGTQFENPPIWLGTQRGERWLFDPANQCIRYADGRSVCADSGQFPPPATVALRVKRGDAVYIYLPFVADPVTITPAAFTRKPGSRRWTRNPKAKRHSLRRIGCDVVLPTGPGCPYRIITSWRVTGQSGIAIVSAGGSSYLLRIVLTR